MHPNLPQKMYGLHICFTHENLPPRAIVESSGKKITQIIRLRTSKIQRLTQNL